MRKRIFYFSILIFVIFLVVFLYFFVGSTKKTENILWGVNFSQKHTENLNLDWKKTFTALLDDLGARRLKIGIAWDFIEGEKRDGYFFDDVDWQISELEKRGAKALLVIGMKTPRWPECHIPLWAKNLSKMEQQEEILELIKTLVQRYKNSPAIWGWQVENEPFFPFGQCPWVDRRFLKKEVALVKSIDSTHPVIISDSGEGSFWVSAARYGDIVGTTLYKRVWMSQIKMYISYPFPPVFYWRKTQLIKKIFGKEVIGVELQAEPWGPKLLYDLTLEEQAKTMDLEQFRKNIAFAKLTGIKEFYLWGAEWMYWMKEKQGDPSIWNEAKKLFQR